MLCSTWSERTDCRCRAYFNFELSTRIFELFPAMIASVSTASPPQPHLPDEQPVNQYRSVAPLAIVAVGVGLASALILVSPLLAPIPVAGIVAAVAALRSIGASQGQLVGRAPAIVGLSLATFFLALGLARHLSRQSVLEQRARETSDVFIGLLQEGKTKEAHQFRQSASLRITAPEAIAEHYEKNADAAKELQSFVSTSPVRDLIGRGKQADVQFEQIVSATRDSQADTLVLKYSFVPAGGGADLRKPMWVHINRRYDDGTKRHQWDVSGVSDAPPPGMPAE
jgi:hypothetical protein